MSKSIFQSLGADATVELHIKTNALALSDLLDENNRIKPEHLPEGASGGNSSEAPQVDLQPLTDRVETLEDNQEKFTTRLVSVEYSLNGVLDTANNVRYLVDNVSTDHNRLNATNKFLLSIFDRDFVLGNPADSYNFTSERAPYEWNEFFQNPKVFIHQTMASLSEKVEELSNLGKMREQVERLNNAIADLQQKSMGFQYDVVGFSYEVTTQAASNGNFATLFLPFAVTLPEGMKAYAVESNETLTSATFKPLDITVLPPNTPVLVSTPTAGSYELASTSWTEPLNTGLKGYMAPFKPYGRLNNRATGIAIYSYILVVENGVAKFVENRKRQPFSANSAALWLASGATVTMPSVV